MPGTSGQIIDLQAGGFSIVAQARYDSGDFFFRNFVLKIRLINFLKSECAIILRLKFLIFREKEVARKKWRQLTCGIKES